MKEIGGYFEFENLVKNEYHHNLLSFSSARNCLLYVIKKRNINKIFLPYYLCDVIKNTCYKNQIEVVFYEIDERFFPIMDKNLVNKDSYLYVVNYYGILNEEDIKVLKNKYKYIILDNTHSFFGKSINGIDTIYNCRKYFGVPDGGYLATDLDSDDTIKYGQSFNRINHLIGRYENSAGEFYQQFKNADLTFDEEELFYMSKFTKNLMGAIDYDYVRLRRKNNCDYLKKMLKNYNELNLEDKDIDFMYPLLIKDAGELRNELISNKIFVPVLWPNVLEDTMSSSIEYRYANDIIPLPIDQRYDIEDMKSIVDLIKKFMSKRGEIK